MDPLSDVLSLLKPRSYVSAGFDAGGDWSIQFRDQQKFIKCYAVISGQCWLSVEGVPDAIRLKTGDCFVLPSGRPFRLASDLALTPVDASPIFSPARYGGVVSYNGGGDFFLVGSRFGVTGSHAGILLGMLPPVVHIWKESDQAALRWSVERMMQELRERQPGSFLVAQHLAHMMLVQALRLHQEQWKDRGISAEHLTYTPDDSLWMQRFGAFAAKKHRLGADRSEISFLHFVRKWHHFHRKRNMGSQHRHRFGFISRCSMKAYRVSSMRSPGSRTSRRRIATS